MHQNQHDEAAAAEKIIIGLTHSAAGAADSAAACEQMVRRALEALGLAEETTVAIEPDGRRLVIRRAKAGVPVNTDMLA